MDIAIGPGFGERRVVDALASVPLNVTGAVGSPANAVAIF
jgi:hypothetical protein